MTSIEETRTMEQESQRTKTRSKHRNQRLDGHEGVLENKSGRLLSKVQHQVR